MNKTSLFLYGVLGIFITIFLNHEFGLGGVISSSLVGLIGGIFFYKHKSIIFSASFIGMSSIGVLISPIIGSISGIFLLIFWKLLEKKFEGVGGKLGTIAFISSLCFSFLLLIIFPSYYNINLINIESWKELSINNYFWIIGCSILGVNITLFIRKKIINDKVIASSLVGLISGLFLSPLLSIVTYCASFAGMSNFKILKNYKNTSIIGLFVGIIFIIGYGILPGIGGKLGAISLLAIISYNKINKTFY